MVVRYTFVPQKLVTERPSPVSNALVHAVNDAGLTAGDHFVKDVLNVKLLIRKLPAPSMATYTCPFDEVDFGLYRHPYVPCKLVVDAVMIANV